MYVDSPTNPTVKLLRSLEQPRHVRKQLLFLVEGVRAVQDGLESGHWPQICLYSADLLKRTERGASLLRRLAARPGKEVRNAPIEASERALAAAGTTQHPQGVVAAFRLPQWNLDAVEQQADPLLLVCDSIQDPGNLGTIFRAAEAAGVSAVFLSPLCVDQFNPKVVRAAMGAHFRLPVFEESDWKDMAASLDRLHVPEERRYAATMDAKDVYYMADWTKPAALIISNEAHGLSGGARSLAGSSLAIPMAGGTESLNAAIAAAVVLFEAARQRALSAGKV